MSTTGEFCEIFIQIASSTWAIHLLKLNKMKTDQCHRAVGRKFPPLSGRERKKFLKTGTSILVVRDPFERLVSAYLDKLAKLNPDPQIQPKRRQIARYIKHKFRSQEQCPSDDKYFWVLSGFNAFWHFRRVPPPILFLKIWKWKWLYEPKEAEYRNYFLAPSVFTLLNRKEKE